MGTPACPQTSTNSQAGTEQLSPCPPPGQSAWPHLASGACQGFHQPGSGGLFPKGSTQDCVEEHGGHAGSGAGARLVQLEASVPDSPGPTVGGSGKKEGLQAQGLSRQWHFQQRPSSPFSCPPGVPLCSWRTWDSGRAPMGHVRALSEKGCWVPDREDSWVPSALPTTREAGWGSGAHFCAWGHAQACQLLAVGMLPVRGLVSGRRVLSTHQGQRPRGRALGQAAGHRARHGQGWACGRSSHYEPRIERAVTALERGAREQRDHGFGLRRPGLVSPAMPFPLSRPLGLAGRKGRACGQGGGLLGAVTALPGQVPASHRRPPALLCPVGPRRLRGLPAAPGRPLRASSAGAVAASGGPRGHPGDPGGGPAPAPCRSQWGPHLPEAPGRSPQQVSCQSAACRSSARVRPGKDGGAGKAQCGASAGGRGP